MNFFEHLMQRNDIHPSLLRTISMPNDISINKLREPRHIHPSFYGSIYPIETPNGPKLGIIKVPSITPKI